MNNQTRELDELRSQIDDIDLNLLHLLNSRAKIVFEIQRIKRDLGLPPYSAARESEIVHRLKDTNTGPLPDALVEDIFRAILQQSLIVSEHADE